MLFVLFQAAVIFLLGLFYVDFKSWMLASPLLPSFYDTYCLSVSSMGSKTLFIVMSFLVPWSICLCPSLIHFQNGPEYLTRRTAQVFIPLLRFLILSLVSSNFLVLQEILFSKLFLLSSLVWWCPHPMCLSINKFPFSPCILIFSWFACSIPSIISVFRF